MTAGSAKAGNYGSGNLGTALTKYGQEMGSNEYANAYARWMDLYNRLAGVSGTGQTTTQQVATMGANTATNMGNLIMAGGQAQASGLQGWQNTFGGMQNQAMSGLGTYLKAQQQQNMMNQLQGTGQQSPYVNYEGYGMGYGDTYSGYGGGGSYSTPT